MNTELSGSHPIMTTHTFADLLSRRTWESSPPTSSGSNVSWQGTTMLIDLRKLREPLAADIRNSLTSFSAQNPNTPICTVGLWGDGFHGTASLHLDTPEHSAVFVEQWLKNGPDWYGEDGQGRFCNSCWDMPHCIGEYDFLGYPDLYQGEADAPVDYITLDGTKQRAEADDGDEGKHRIVFPFLKDVLAEFEPSRQLLRVAPFRVGVQMRDSLCAEFWPVALDGCGS